MQTRWATPPTEAAADRTGPIMSWVKTITVGLWSPT